MSNEPEALNIEHSPAIVARLDAIALQLQTTVTDQAELKRKVDKLAFINLEILLTLMAVVKERKLDEKIVVGSRPAFFPSDRLNEYWDHMFDVLNGTL